MYAFICGHDPFPCLSSTNKYSYREITRHGTISRHQSSKFGIWIRHLDISYLVISHDMGYDITIYRDVLCDITPDHPETTGNHTRNLGLLFVLALSLPSSWLVFLPSRLFCRPSVVHQRDTSYYVGLTAHHQQTKTATLSTHCSACSLSAYIFVLFHLVVFFPLYFFVFLSFSPSWYP